MGIFFDESTRDPIRPRQGCDIPATIDNYAAQETRQEMGVKLNTFLNTVTGDPHADALMAGGTTTARQRDIGKYIRWAPKMLHARTAKNPYQVEAW